MKKTWREGQALRLRSGQVMILTVLALGGTILGATTVAGLLMLYQIRQATDLANSAKAIFAADAGLEWALYQFFTKDTAEALPTPLTNGAAISVKCFLATGEEKTCDNEEIMEIRSVGRSVGSSRAFRLSL